MKGEAEAARRAAENDFAKLVERLARDEATENEVASVLKLSDKTLAELETATDRQRRINKLKTIVADLPELEVSYRVARAAQKDLEADHKQRVKQMEDEFRLARRAVSAASVRTQRAQEARAELYRLCPPQVDEPAPAVEVQLATEAALPPCSQERFSVMLPSDA
jgi:3-methyladenine DNA glycosylase/8-oxoguanine DNA glycosylase